MVRKIIIETQFLPPISVMSHLLMYDQVILEGHETYQKRSYRNRLHVVDAQGKKSISIPLVKGKHEQQSIRQVDISYDTSWDISFLRLIKAAYGSAPYFDYYYDDIVEIIGKKHTSLWDLNYDMLLMVIEWLGVNLVLSTSDAYKTDYEGSDIDDARGIFLPTNPASTHLSYDQVFMERHGFVSDLSILDLLLCCGPEAPLYLSNTGEKHG